MTVEIFANQPTTTVSSGGTTAPAQGTSQSWTVASSTTFPAASSSAVPPSQFHVVDIASGKSSEVIAVTNISGTTWTVTRGVEGTTPVAHTAGFTIQQVVTAGYLTGTSTALSHQTDWLNVVTRYGADSTGSTDATAAIQAAVTAAIDAGGGVVYLPSGSYKVESTITGNVTGVAVYIIGDGNWATTIYFYGSGDCLRIYDTTSDRTVNGGGVVGMTIDGTNSSGSAASSALHMGDMFQYRVDMAVQNFANFTGSIGVHFDNQYSWTEQLYGRLFVTYCNTGVMFDHASGAGSSSTGSYDRLNMEVYLDQSNNVSFDGVTWNNGANMQDGNLTIRGNFGGSNSTVTAAVLRITGQSPAGSGDVGTYSSLLYSQIYIGVECDSLDTNGPYCIYFGDTVNNFIQQCSGQLNFYAATTAFQASNGGGNFDFAGDLNGAGNLSSSYVMTTIDASFINLFGDSVDGPSQISADTNNMPTVDTPAGLVLNLQLSQPAATSAVTVANTTQQTSLGSLSVPANDPVGGAAYRFALSGGISTATSPPTYICDVRWGGTAGTLLTSLRSTAPANSPALVGTLTSVPIKILGDVDFRTGTTCTCSLQMFWTNSSTPATAATYSLSSTISTITVPVSGTESLSVDWQWSASSASNIITIASSSFERVS